MINTLRTAVCAAAIATVAVVPIVAEVPAHGASAASRQTPSTDFTAAVRAIHHGSGTVTLVGTAPSGTSVELAGDVLETVWTEAGPDRTWKADVRVRVGAERIVRVTSQVSGRVIDVPVTALITEPPSMIAQVAGIDREIRFEGHGHPLAHFVLEDDGTTIGEVDADADGHWRFTATNLAFGLHHIEAFQYFDGAQNGGVDEVYEVSGAPTVTQSNASRETGRITVSGRAPAGTTVALTDHGVPVTGVDGRPVRVRVGADTTWRAEFPIPDGARLMVIDATSFDGATELGSARAAVTVPFALAGTVEQQADGTLVVAGTGELGGTVALETEGGTPVKDAQGAPVETVVGPPAQHHGYSWRLTVSPEVLPRDAAAIVVRQRVDGVEQGALRLVLPGRPHRPDPGHGAGPGISSGTHAPTPHASSARIRAGHGRLAYTGADPLPAVVLAGLLTAMGSSLLVVSRVTRRHRRHR